MLIKEIFLGMVAACFGLLSAAGVFTVLTAVGLVPRFAGKTHTARKVFLFEEMVILGTVVGSFVSVFPQLCQVGGFWQEYSPGLMGVWLTLGQLILAVYGLFSGMFIGCLALAIAEMLDSIPIFARRISLRHGIGLVILGVAIGKVCGSLLYFSKELHRVME